ncbi:hypothetical protein [Haloplanus pelagicus]|jgi:hypothetical protein|uniref:hypothetical protein n=1 Tax=Haloplanus pelagicus TaxID=2949995 RepID=UPI00203D4AAA|nr:hypothetical protein [Haloplanus sp. HW8-1]
MSTVPADVDTDRQPPLAIPLWHFVIALAFLLVGTGVGLGDALGLVPGLARLAHLHLLLVGFVCLTIAGAMTQFVPVWSGTALHSRRLARAQLWLVGGGLLGLAAGFLSNRLAVLPPAGALVLLGFWTLAYNVGRTLAAARPLDVTERHFAVALGCFVALTPLGLLLATGFVSPVFDSLPVTRGGVVGAHATLAVFGAVLTTVFGALYQLVPMFGQTELDGLDRRLQRVETVAYPVSVVLLALARLVGSAPLARVGAVLLLTSVLAFILVLARLLADARAARTPMLVRYALLVPTALAWAALTVPAWLRAPLDATTRLGAPDAGHLLALTLLFVLVGTLYHVVPFLVWVHRYSDRLGFEDVPMIDDLYDGRLARADLYLVAGGGALLVAGDLFARPGLVVVGGGALGLGLVTVAANLSLVIWRHAPGLSGRGPAFGSTRGE